VIKEGSLVVENYYKIPSTGIAFVLEKKYHPNRKCFMRITDKHMFFGREFIEYRDGQRLINLVEDK